MNRLLEPKQLRFKDDKARHRSVAPGSLRVVGEIEVAGQERPAIELQMLSYFKVDSYGSLWTPGVLTRGVSLRLPQLAWGHLWHETLGRALPGTYVDNEIGPRMWFYLDDFDAVPRAKQAYAQVGSGTIDECSIGFGWDYIARDPTDEERERFPGVREVMIEAELDEVSLVLRGAVPDAKVAGVRTRSRHLGLRVPMMVDAEEAARILTEVKGGDMDLLTALQQMKEASVPAADVTFETEEPVKETETEQGQEDKDDAEKIDAGKTEVEPGADAASDDDDAKDETTVDSDKSEPTVEDKTLESEPEAEPKTNPDEVVPPKSEPETQKPEIEAKPDAEPELQPVGESNEEIEADMADFADVDAVIAGRDVI